MSADTIITLAGTVITVLFAALHVSGRISSIETKVDLMMDGFTLTPRVALTTHVKQKGSEDGRY